jgi:hypothetical protein
MSQVCSKCSRINPPDAAYCYWDGAVLEGHHANGGGIAVGSRPFPNQFVFPSGEPVCRNFDQLAMSCQQNWKQAVECLRNGYLSSFLGGMGRADLALAAQEAARFPDQDRGLDQLLAKLPSHVLDAPRLQVEPSDVNLGVIKVGSDRKLELHLGNQGMRLLYGSVVSDCKWLTLGDGPGNAQKLFQFGNDAVVPVHVRGQHLRAGNKPLEGRLVVESNGGTATIKVRAQVPIKPYPDGVLAGALTPRNIAEKAKAHPKEAAVLFEKGAVAQWFKDNGWTYPVQGPSASGLGAVQQFFEALGLATAPKLEISQRSLSFRGDVGQSLQATLEVRTPEKRPVYAHARADESWLDVSKTTLNGRIATIQVRIPSVPNRPGQKLTATIRVTGNGNQRFKVPVSLAVGGAPYADAQNPFSLEAVPVLTAVPVPDDEPLPVVAVTAQPVASRVPAAVPVEVVSRPIRVRKARLPHLIPAGVLFVVLLGIIGYDYFTKGTPGEAENIDPRPRIDFYFEDGSSGLSNYMRFGVVTKDPNNPKANTGKKLTFDQVGRTNNTLVKNDNADWAFGVNSGRWEVMSEKVPPKDGKFGGRRSVWMFDDGIRVTQTVELIPGEPIEITPGNYQRLLDTCLVRYDLENKDKRAHKVGLRAIVDTLIGANDGVPFTVPGVPGMVDTFKDFPTPGQVPDFIQALEVPNLRNPQTVAQMNFKLGGKIEPPSRVSLTRWPGMGGSPSVFPFWLVPLVPIRDDSCVVMYWEPRELQPGHKREVGYSYGVGSVSTQSGELGVTVGGTFAPGGELTVVGYVNNPQPKQKLSLMLPEGFTFVEGTQTQDVPPATPNRPSPVTWRIRSTASGRFELTVYSSTGAEQKKQVTIKRNTIF